MGKIIAVCSDDKKSGKSIVTYLLSNKIKRISPNNLKILVCCLNLNYSALYKLFGIDFSAVGLEDLVNYKFYEEEKSEILLDIIPQSEDIYFLGSYRTTHSYIKKNIEKYYKLFEKLQDSFDLIIFDTVSGNGNVLTDYVLDKADVMLRLFVQDNESMQKLCDKGIKLSYGREIIYIVSKYRDIYPRVSDIKHEYSLKNVFTVDYCEKLQEMKNKNNLHLYSQHETSCNDSVKCISKYILKTMSLINQESSVKESQSRYKRNLRNTLKRLRLISDGGEGNEDTAKFVPKRVDGLY